MHKSLLSIIVLTIFCGSAFAEKLEFDKNASLRESPTKIIGVNHIGLSVKDLDRAIAFYQGATGFKVVRRETFKHNEAANALFAQDNVEVEVAVLQAPNWLLELNSFKHNESVETTLMPVIGPGMNHTCYQSPNAEPAYPKFMKQGARMLNRDQKPVYSPHYGVSYVYAYDPEGNLMELEQLKDGVLEEAGYPGTWEKEGKNVWMSQVSLFTHDRDRLMSFYQKIFNIKANRSLDLANSAFADELFDVEDASVKIGWFRLNHKSKMMEILEFVNPATPQSTKQRYPGDLGYSYSLEVSDIQEEYIRLKALDVEFFSAPKKLGLYWQVFARDIDGNIFSLRQTAQANSPFSVRHFDPTAE